MQKENKPHRQGTTKPRSNTPKSSDSEQNHLDAPKSHCDYTKMTPKQLNTMAKRVLVLHETGAIIPSEENEEKIKPFHSKPASVNDKGAQVTVQGTTSSQLNSHTSERPKRSRISEVIEGMSEEQRKKFKKREERLLHAQQRDLLKHPELTGVEEIEVPSVDLSQDKREWIQRFIDSMSADRIDYEKPEKRNIVEGVTHKRPSDVHFTEDQQLANSLDAKTILQRIDFEKGEDKRSRSKSSSVDGWLKRKGGKEFPVNDINATSTPKPKTEGSQSEDGAIPSILTIDSVCNDTLPESPNVFTSTRIGSILDESSSNFAHLDRSNITLRTPRSKMKNTEPVINDPEPNQNKEAEIMNYVDQLLAAEEDSINQEARERCERMLQIAKGARDILRDALDRVLVAHDDAADGYEHIDNSIEIVDPIPNTQPNKPVIDNNYVQVIDSDDDDVIPVVDVIEILDTPSTSKRAKTHTRKKPVKGSPALPQTRSKKRNAFGLPSISEVALSDISPKQPDVATEDKPARSLNDCPICLESLAGKEISSTICGHVFCTSCIAAAVRSKRACPTCRSSLSLKKIHPLFI